MKKFTKLGPKPPGYDMGAENTTALIDWVEFTLPEDEPEQIKNLLSYIIGGKFADLERGLHGYKAQSMLDTIRVLSDGSENMGCHVIIPGKACRVLEGKENFHSWEKFFKTLQKLSASYSRVDLALDDKDKKLSLDDMIEAVEVGNITSKWQRYKVELSGNIGEAAKGKTLYLGSSQSKTMLRIYDKAGQLFQLARQQGEEYTGPEHWIRVELQMRDERASSFIEAVLNGSSVRQAVGLLKFYLDFKVPNEEDTNKSRWESASWWAAFLNHAQTLCLSIDPIVRTLEKTWNYLYKQVSSSFAMVFQAMETNETDIRKIPGLWDIYFRGSERMKPWQRSLVSSALATN